MDAQELEALGLGMIISLGLLASEIFLVAMYLSQWKKGASGAKLQPYLMAIYFLICLSIATGLLAFYRGEGSTPKSALQVLALVSLFPNFVIMIVVVLTYAHRRDRVLDSLVQSSHLSLVSFGHRPSIDSVSMSLPAAC